MFKNSEKYGLDFLQFSDHVHVLKLVQVFDKCSEFINIYVVKFCSEFQKQFPFSKTILRTKSVHFLSFQKNSFFKNISTFCSCFFNSSDCSKIFVFSKKKHSCFSKEKPVFRNLFTNFKVCISENVDKFENICIKYIHFCKKTTFEFSNKNN